MILVQPYRPLCIAIALVSGTFVSAGGAAEIMQPSDLIAGFQYNRSLFPKLRVIYERAVEVTDAFEKLNPQSTQPARTAIIEDYWTDGTRFLLRMPRDFAVGETYSVPDNNMTPDVLLSMYKETFVFSYGTGSASGFRLWSGIEKAGLGVGLVGKGPISGKLGEFVFPPLAVADQSWGSQGIWHPIDAFFANPPSEMKVLGEIRVDDADTVVVEHVARKPAAPFLQQQFEGKLENADVMTAWIDTNRGFLPLRLIRSNWLLFDGQRRGAYSHRHDLNPDRMLEASHVVRVSRIEDCDGGGFYPMEGVRADRTGSPDYRGPYNDIQGLLEGKVVDIPMVDVTRIHWRVHELQANQSMPEESLALSFPKQTRYFDESRARGMIEGIAEDELDRLIAEEQERMSRPNSRYPFRWLFIAVNVAVIAGLVFFFWSRRKTR